MKNFFNPNSIESKSLQKILKSKKSKFLKYRYEGETKNKIPHTPESFGTKFFEEQDRNDYTEAGFPYDLEMLQNYFTNTYAQESFYFMGQRYVEEARYINGVPEGPVKLTIGIEGLDYNHYLYCNFKNGLPNGSAMLYESYKLSHDLYEFDNGSIVNATSFDNLTDLELSKITDNWKKYKNLYNLMKEDLELYE